MTGRSVTQAEAEAYYAKQGLTGCPIASDKSHVSNLATLEPAPPFTKENAREMAMRAVAKRRAKIAARQQATARPAIEPEINRIVRAMTKLSVTSDDYAALVQHLDKLWNKAFPTQGAVKSRVRDRAPSAIPIEEAAETPQEPPASPVS